jgi:L-amino acid N-acyltransferase YncA
MSDLYIRLAEEKDGAAMRAIYAYYVEHTHVSFEYTAPDDGEFLSRIQATVAEFPWLVCLHGGQVIGFAYAHKHRVRDAYQWSPESTIYLASGFHTKGIGRVLYETLFAILRVQGYHHVFAGVALPNEKSVAIHQRLGFEQIGVFRKVGYKNGKWYDTQWFQLHLQPQADVPVTPRKLPLMQHAAEFTTILIRANQQLARTNTTLL